MTVKTRATIDDLYREPGKAEIVDGEIVRLPAAGIGPGYAGGETFISLHEYAKRLEFGLAVEDNKVFSVALPNRKSFSPSAAYVAKEVKFSMKFFEGAPVFAAEVRTESDYGPAAERARTRKRADYFAAGTLVVWDVDLLSEDIVRVYRASTPDMPTAYRRGDLAEADPGVPGWRLAVDDLFM
jgi:Uma2 family endonuclease